MQETVNFLQHKWNKVLLLKGIDKQLPVVKNFFDDIIQHHTEPQRFYHTINHLQALFLLIEQYKDKLKQPTAIYFAIFYHDIIYNSLRNDNEVKSADYARQVLQSLNLSEVFIQKVEALILATQKHLPPPDADSDFHFFLDADLAILGSNWATYNEYAQAIRKEYVAYPDPIYKAGRKKVLNSLLSNSPLFYTEEIRQVFDEQARSNMKKELLAYV